MPGVVEDEHARRVSKAIDDDLRVPLIHFLFFATS